MMNKYGQQDHLQILAWLAQQNPITWIEPLAISPCRFRVNHLIGKNCPKFLKGLLDSFFFQADFRKWLLESEICFWNIPLQNFTRNFFLDLKICGLLTFAEACIL